MEIYKTFDKKQKMIILIGIIFSIISIIAGIIYDRGKENIELSMVTRPESYEEANNISFKMKVDGIDDKEDLSYFGKVGARRLKENEINAYLNETLNKVEASMFREGESSKEVRSGLNIPPFLDKNPVNISFSTDTGEVFLENGDINFELIKEKQNVNLKLKATYERKEVERVVSVIVYPRTLTEEERVKQKLMERMDETFESGENEIVYLPSVVYGHKVNSYIPRTEITGSIAGFALASLICLFVVFNENNKRKIKEREEELKNGYTEFVGRFVILLGAGLSISAVWKKLEKGFLSNKSLSEEIRLTLWETGNGKTEREAYENFAKRIGGTQYAKFVSVINQSLKLGSGQLLTRLEAESEAAMFERRNKAKVMGEVADTKMLMPMMLQLVLIMLIIMVPALMAV